MVGSNLLTLILVSIEYQTAVTMTVKFKYLAAKMVVLDPLADTVFSFGVTCIRDIVRACTMLFQVLSAESCLSF